MLEHKVINDLTNSIGWNIGFVRFRVDHDEQNAGVVFELVDDSVAATFAFLDVTIFETSFKDRVS